MTAGHTSTGLQVPARPGEKDEVYYWDTVEGYVFKVPKYQFAIGSEYFANMYLQGVASCSTPELDPDDDWDSMDVTDAPGLRISTAGSVALEGVTAAQFRTFLKLLFPMHSTTTTLTLTKSEWLTVLTLSTRWHFLEFRKLAMTRLDPQMSEAVEMITVGRREFMPEWVLEGYEELIVKEGEISEEESEQIGDRTAVRLYIVRHGLADNACENGAWSREVRKRVEEKFADELVMLKREERARRTRDKVALEEEEERKEKEEEVRKAKEKEEEARKAREKEEEEVRQADERETEVQKAKENDEEVRREKAQEEEDQIKLREQEALRAREEDERKLKEVEQRVRQEQEEQLARESGKRELKEQRTSVGDPEQQHARQEQEKQHAKKGEEGELNELVHRAPVDEVRCRQQPADQKTPGYKAARKARKADRRKLKEERDRSKVTEVTGQMDSDISVSPSDVEKDAQDDHAAPQEDANKREDVDRRAKEHEEKVAAEKRRKEESLRNAIIEQKLQEELAFLIEDDNKRRRREERAAEHERRRRVCAAQEEKERQDAERRKQDIQAFWRMQDEASSKSLLGNIIGGIGRVLPHVPPPAPTEAEKAAWEASWRRGFQTNFGYCDSGIGTASKSNASLSPSLLARVSGGCRIRPSPREPQCCHTVPRVSGTWLG